jgi:biopolymer transport protein ExbD
MRTLWIVLLCLCACKRHHPAQQSVHDDAGPALQSFADGMAALCAGKPNDAAYFKSHVMNPEAITLYEAIGDVSPAKRAERIRAAVAKANLGSCALLEKMLAVPAANAPTVTGLGLVELAPHALAISATDTGIVVDAKPAQLASLEQTLTAIAKAKPGGTLVRVQLVLATTLTAQLLLQLADATDKAGFKDLALVVNADGVSRAIPFTQRDVATGRGVRPEVAISATSLRLYSGDGSEGTQDKPKASVASPAELAAALNELAVRRWHGKRTDDDRWLYVTVDPATPIQRVADVLAVLRAMPDGGELFPQIALAH